MATTSISVPWPGARAGARIRSLRGPRPELLGLIALAAVLDLWALDRNGYANTYYSAAVRSMTQSWHAFLYGSFDAAGVMTADKPPLALWIQAASARVFGFSSWSLLAPQALMGVATVALVYDIARRRFGRPAGFVAGLVLALTPATVAIFRHNNPDALLVLCVTAAVWALVRGLEDGRTRWLAVSGICVGLGFEAKMGAALLVVPALAAAWLWVAPRGRLAAVRQLAAGGAAMTVVGLAWPVLVWLTPASGRPWVAGTSDNSVWSLIFGYNGLGRLLGQDGGPGGGAGGPGGGAGGPGGAGNGLFGGQPGALRLFNEALGGQAAWLLGFAVVSGLAVLAATGLRRADPRTGWIVAVGGTFAITAVAFSQAHGIFHPYYVSELAPFTALLTGAGVAMLSKRGLAARLLAPLAIVAGVVAEIAILHENPGELRWLPGVIVAAGAGAAFLLGASANARLRAVALTVAVGALLVAPATWAAQTLGHATNGTFPAGGPAWTALAGPSGGGAGPRGAAGMPGGTAGAPGPPGGTAAAPGGTTGAPAPGGAGAGAGATSAGGPFGGTSGSLTRAIAYVRSHGGGTIAVASQSGAAQQVTITGAKIAGLGGFSGRESQVSLAWLADAVQSGKIRWVLTDGASGLPADGRTGADDVLAVARRVGTRVASVSGLYDLQGKAGALRAAAS
jgi:4-amino-4-deoxy-L-arabinose transferase-like glycosyltransferase